MFLGHLIAHALGRTRGGQFFNMVMMLFFVTAMPVGAVVGFSIFIWHELAKESSYHQRFGENWNVQYEAEQGSLSSARTKMAVAALAAVAIAFLGVWLYRQLIPALRGEGYRPNSSSRRRRKRK
jgi:uncharacterized membrane protein